MPSSPKLAPLRALACAVGLVAAAAPAAEFATPGGPLPAGIAEVESTLRREPYDLELLISFGTSKGGSAGHLALALRDDATGEETVHSANFYADRAPEHAKDFYTEELMTGVPKREYLFGTSSSLGDKASFGLDYGEVYKRSVVGVRVRGVPADERRALAAYFARMNADYRNRARDVEYHDGEVKYDYFRLNCAKTIGAAFKYGAGYRDLDVTSAKVLKRRRVVAAATANIPAEMAIKLLEQWHARGYGMDVVLYRKYPDSPYVDPHGDEKVAFRDLPNRFPSTLSLDFVSDEGEYEDYDNLYAMYLLHDLASHSVRVDGVAQRAAIESSKAPMAYAEAKKRAAADAESDSRGFLGRLLFKPKGTRIGSP